MSSTLRAFAPAIIFYPLWLYTMSSHNLWIEVFSSYWPVSCAVIFGSFIAGSTPLSGGVVAYPVSQMIMVLPAADARDASILVQSIGMNAAAYLLYTTKRELLHPTLILTFTVVGAWGVLLGTVLSPSPGLSNILFASIVLLFAIAFFYIKELSPCTPQPQRLTPPSQLRQTSLSSGLEDSPPSTLEDSTDERDTPRTYLTSEASSSAALSLEQPSLSLTPSPPQVETAAAQMQSPKLTWTLMVSLALLGGMLTANVGSGSDILLYAFGTFGWNCLQPHMQIPDRALTANTVVVMGALSVFTAITRALNGGFSRGVILGWGADAFIVVVGAPIGSIFLTPAASKFLRKLLYVLALVQFTSYAVLEEAFHDASVAPYVGRRVWAYLAVALAFELMLLGLHNKWRTAQQWGGSLGLGRRVYSYEDMYSYALSARHSRKCGSHTSLYAMARNGMSSESLVHLV